MENMFRFLLASNRKRRRRAAAVALWVLRALRDVESDEMWRCLDLLDSFDEGGEPVPRHEYNAVEDRCTSCEFAASALDSAIDGLELAY